MVIWTAYGAPAYERLVEVVAAAKQDDPLAPVTILVPTNLCGIVARRRLAAGVRGRHGRLGGGGGHGVLRGVAGIAVLTVDRLAERLAAPTLVGSGRRPATGPVLAAAWRGALAEDAGVFEPVAGHPATVRALVTAHRELRDADEAGIAAIERHGGPVQRDLVRLHREVVARLAGFYDVADLRRAALTVLSGQIGREIGSVVLFLPQDLPRDAGDLVRAVAATTQLTVIAGHTGVPRADAAVLRTVGRVGEPPDPAAGAHATPLATAIRHASDADDEVRVIVRELMTALRSRPAHRVAVLYGAAEPYARLLAEHLAAAGLTRNGAGVRPTVERTLARLLLDLLALPAHGWRRDEVTSVIARATVRTADDRRLPSAMWERMSREAGVVAGGDWEARLTRYATDLRETAPADASDGYRRYVASRAATAEALRDFVLDLRAHLDQGAALRTWPELARWAQQAFARVTGDLPRGGLLPEDEVRAADRIHSVLSGLAGLGALERSADVETLRGALELELGDDLPRHGKYGTGLLVAPLSESIGLDADLVFVVGLADDLVPGQVAADALLDDEVRAHGGLRPRRERIDRAHRQLLAAFAAARVSIASFPRGDLRRSSARLPSRWLLPTLRRRSGRPDIDASRWDRAGIAADFLSGSPSFAAALSRARELASEQEWRVRAATSMAAQGGDPAAALPDDRVVARALALARARRSGQLTRFDGDLSGHPVPVPGADHLTSPTALESWARCPHGYFVERLLGVRPLEAPEEIVLARAIDVGSIVHESLDRFYQTYGHAEPGRSWTTDQRTGLHAIARTIADTYTAHGLTGHPVLWERELVGILHALDTLLDQDTALRAETGRRQVRSELPFGMGGEPPVELALPSGRTIRIRGSADRVDQTTDGAVVVVDYKTGSDRSYQDISEANPTAYGSRLQLPVYAKAARAALGGADTPVSAEYWFVGRSTSRIGVPLTDDVDRIFTETVDVIVSGIAAGLFPQRPPQEDFGWLGGGGGSARHHFAFGCPSCDPDGLGAGEVRRAWTRKRADPRLSAYRSVVEPEEAQ